MSERGAPAVLRSRDFRLLWVAHAVSLTGDSLTWLALILTINRLTGSAGMIATLSVVLTLPQLFLGLLAGVMADRWDRRRTMIASDLARAGIVLGFLLVRGPGDLWLFYLLGLLHVVVGVFFSPARAAFTPRLVAADALLPANSLLQTTQIIAGLVGTGLAGFLVPLAKSGWPAFVLDSASFLVSAACVAAIATHGRAAATEVEAAVGDPARTGWRSGRVRSVLADLREGLAFLFRTRVLLAVLTAFGVASLGTGAVSVLFVPFLVNTLREPAASVALAKGAQVAGMLLGGAWMVRSGARGSDAMRIGGGLAGIGLATILLGLAPGLVAVLATLFLLGLFATPMHSATNALLQRRTPNPMLGRVESGVDTLLLVVMMASMALAGTLADRVGIREVLYGSGLLCVVGGGVGWILLTRASGADPVPVKRPVEEPGSRSEERPVESGWIGPGREQ